MSVLMARWSTVVEGERYARLWSTLAWASAIVEKATARVATAAGILREVRGVKSLCSPGKRGKCGWSFGEEREIARPSFAGQAGAAWPARDGV